jgi:hypothetical protein
MEGQTSNEEQPQKGVAPGGRRGKTARGDSNALKRVKKSIEDANFYEALQLIKMLTSRCTPPPISFHRSPLFHKAGGQHRATSCLYSQSKIINQNQIFNAKQPCRGFHSMTSSSAEQL